MDKLELIDWSERFPNEGARTVAIRQSTFCLCGRPKAIGAMTCSAHGRTEIKITPRPWRLASLGFILFDTVVGLGVLCTVVASVTAIIMAWSLVIGGL